MHLSGMQTSACTSPHVVDFIRLLRNLHASKEDLRLRPTSAGHARGLLPPHAMELGTCPPTTELIELRPRRPRPERLRRAPATSTMDHVDHVPSGSTELRPPRPPDHVAMMIATKNDAMTTATTITTGQKARGPDNFIAID